MWPARDQHVFTASSRPPALRHRCATLSPTAEFLKHASATRAFSSCSCVCARRPIVSQGVRARGALSRLWCVAVTDTNTTIGYGASAHPLTGPQMRECLMLHPNAGRAGLATASRRVLWRRCGCLSHGAPALCLGRRVGYGVERRAGARLWTHGQRLSPGTGPAWRRSAHSSHPKGGRRFLCSQAAPFQHHAAMIPVEIGGKRSKILEKDACATR